MSQEYGHWLGDAFASGGSVGYDHKAMGITARGAWESVKRFFREQGRDIQSSPFTVVGIGDMSGDVFGNGMLLSPHIRLLAAFDHRHVFLDPDPDAAAAFAERERLFKLPRSSWADYDTSLISAGGGVWARSEKSIPLSPAGACGARHRGRAARARRAAERAPEGAGRPALQRRHRHLREGKHGDARRGRRPRQRRLARQRRAICAARSSAKAATSGFTQRGRIEAALNGVSINTDAIDNSAGVDTSDHEVNIKILLGLAVADGEITEEQRNAVLRR